MSYTTLNALKSFGGFKNDTEDELLSAILLSAKDFIDKYTGRVFDVDEETTRTYSRYRGARFERFSNTTLYLDESLAEEASAITDSPTVFYLPENGTPKNAIVLVEGAWAYPQVQVTGYFGYSKVAPPAIEQACLRIAKWMYDMKTTNPGDTIIVSPEGQLLLPQGLPNDITTMLAAYRKLKVA